MDHILGEGKTAKVFLEGAYAVKKFNEGISKEYIDKERSILKIVKSKTNIKVPSVYDSDTRLIKMDHIDGPLLGDKMRKEKYKFACEDMIDIQLSIHQYEDLPLENAHDVYAEVIASSKEREDYKKIALDSLKKIKRKTSLCHFDFHPLNIMYAHEGYYVIDWMNAKNGNPILDIARTYIILRRVALRFSSKYLTQVTKKLHISKDSIYQAIPAIAMIRLIVDQPLEDRAYLLELIEQYH